MTFRVLFLLIACGVGRLSAQAQRPVIVEAQGPVTVEAPGDCDGRIVRQIRVLPAPPPFAGSAAKWRAAARAVGLHHATTQSEIIESFLALHVGQRCTEFRLVESERVLRAQPFIAAASVRVVPDSTDGAVVIVETTDEIPVLVGARFRGVAPDALTIGNGNIAGAGLRVIAGWEAARAYQTGFGGSVVKYAAGGHPYVARAEAYRHRIGYSAIGEVSHPFYTDLQRLSWYLGASNVQDYPHFNRPARDALSLRVRDERWGVSGISRLFGTSVVALLGGAVMGRLVEPAERGVVLSDTGFAVDTGVALRNRYSPFKATRVGVIGGLRRVNFVTLSGFDALAAAQDVPNGVLAALFAAHGLKALGESDIFLSAATYAGIAGPAGILANVAEVEGRRDLTTNEWDSIVGSTRTALYLGGNGRVLILSDEYSGGVRSRLPMQLTFSDRVGGIGGYRSSSLAGSRRNVVRGEARLSGTALVRRADLGVAAFGEVGSLWAGDAPYGTTATRSSVGVSLLAAYPTRSKRLYRVDLAIPMTRGGEGGGRVEVRFSSEDRTTRFWEEPYDVSRARTGALPSTLFAWPAR